MDARRLLLALLAVTVCSALEGPRRHKCEPITIPLCRDMPYNVTRMPKLLEHETQEEAASLVSVAGPGSESQTAHAGRCDVDG